MKFQSAPGDQAGRNRLVVTVWRTVGCNPVSAKRRFRATDLAFIGDRDGRNMFCINLLR